MTDSQHEVERLSVRQIEVLKAAANGGTTMFDGNEARTASSLAAKGLVRLPAGHGHYFGSYLLRVTATDAGRALLNDINRKTTPEGK